MPSRLEDRVREKARALGFDAVGIARADEPLTADFEHYERFLDRGMHGEMRYLAEDRLVRRRLDTEAILDGARSVVCVARRYDRSQEEEANDPPLARRIARYARGRDYHNGVRKKLRQLAAFIRTLGEGVNARPLIDDAPVLERAWAARAGLGFVGKNGLLIVPGQGSFVLLGEVVTTLPLEPNETIPDRCGSCTLCIEECPTEAIIAPRVLDAKRCISYLTIELRGSMPEELREKVGGNLFGCDDCQTVCPYNKDTEHKREARAGAKVDVFSPHPRWAGTSLGDLVGASSAEFAVLSEGSPLHRATHAGLARNAAIVMGNVGGDEPGGPEASNAVLEKAANSPENEVVRDAASWALARMSKGR